MRVHPVTRTSKSLIFSHVSRHLLFEDKGSTMKKTLPIYRFRKGFSAHPIYSVLAFQCSSPQAGWSGVALAPLAVLPVQAVIGRYASLLAVISFISRTYRICRHWPHSSSWPCWQHCLYWSNGAKHSLFSSPSWCNNTKFSHFDMWLKFHAYRRLSLEKSASRLSLLVPATECSKFRNMV